MRRVGQECNGIIILESLGEERDTAARLQQTLEGVVATEPRWERLFVRRTRISSRADLLRELTAVRDAFLRGTPHPLRPMVHFEMHGDEDGIGLQPSGGRRSRRATPSPSQLSSARPL